MSDTTKTPTAASGSLSSRLLSSAAAIAVTFASNEVAVAAPYVKAAVDELPADLLASKPLVALGHTLAAAGEKIIADKGAIPSITGLLGALFSAFI